jgi:hypothetical protein
MTSQGYPIKTPIFQPLVGTSSSSSSGASPDRNSIEDYPEIRGNICWNATIEAHHISMVGPDKAPSHNNSTRYPTIRVSEVSDAWTPSNRIVQNLNLNFNTMGLQTIMESLQHMVPQDSPLVVLAQQGVEVVGQIVAVELSAGNHRGKPSIGNRSADRAKGTWSKEASSTSKNRRLANNEVHRQITQNRWQRMYGRDSADLHNVINDRRRLRTSMSSPQWRSPAWAPTPSGRVAFCALAPKLGKVAWPDKLKLGTIDKYDDSSNPKEFIQIYHMVIDATGGDD